MPKGHFVPPQLQVFSSRKEESIPTITDQPQITIQGEVQDNQFVKDVFIFRNEQKVFYQSSSSTTSSQLEFATELPLEPGLNRVILFARDDQELIAQKEIEIWREEK